MVGLEMCPWLAAAFRGCCSWQPSPSLVPSWGALGNSSSCKTLKKGKCPCWSGSLGLKCCGILEHHRPAFALCFRPRLGFPKARARNSPRMALKRPRPLLTQSICLIAVDLLRVKANGWTCVVARQAQWMHNLPACWCNAIECLGSRPA